MSKIVLDDIIDYLDDVHKYDGYYMALCPLHQDSNPSLQVTERGYYCLSGCGGGSLEKLYFHITGNIVFKDKKTNYTGLIWSKWEQKFGNLKSIYNISNDYIASKPELYDYLGTRGFNWQDVGYLDGYYIFPIYNEFEELSGLIARASPEIQTKKNRYSVSPDCLEHLYVPNWYRTLKSEEIYVVYGIFDAWTIDSLGYSVVTGISGKSLRAEYLDRFRKPMHVIPDKGEEQKAQQLQKYLGWRCQPLYLDWPDGTKDVNEVHMKFSLDTVSRLIDKAKEKYNYARIPH